MPFPITSKTGEEITLTVFGTYTAPDGSVTRVDLRSIRVSVDSGDGTFSQDPARPMEFIARAGAEGETVYAVTGTQNGPEVSDTVVYTVTAGEVAPGVATALGFEASEPEPQGPHPDQGLPKPQAGTLPAAKKR